MSQPFTNDVPSKLGERISAIIMISFFIWFSVFSVTGLMTKNKQNADISRSLAGGK